MALAQFSFSDPITITAEEAIPLLSFNRSDINDTIDITHSSNNLLTFSCKISATSFSGSGSGLTNIPPSAFLPDGIDGQVLTKLGTSWLWSSINNSGNNSATTAVTFLTGDSTLTSDSSIVIIDSSTECSITLPPGINNTVITIKNAGTGSVIVIPNDSDLITKTTSFGLLSENSMNLVYYSGNWYII